MIWAGKCNNTETTIKEIAAEVVVRKENAGKQWP